jgi:hypothetical protein
MGGGTRVAGRGRVLLVDLGGGSCEITLSEKKRIKDTISVPLGAVRLTEEFLPRTRAAEGWRGCGDGLARTAAGAQKDSAGTGFAGDCDVRTAAALSERGVGSKSAGQASQQASAAGPTAGLV